MQTCNNCNVSVDDDAKYCPECGKRLGGDPREPDERVGSLLASADLNKIRGEWDLAVADATEALRLDPNNADVASLLASIYEQNDNLDEAVVWYQVALELNPKRFADRARLQLVSERIAAAGKQKITGPITLAGKRPWARWGAAALAIIVLIVLLVVFGRPGGKHDRSGRVIYPG